MKEIISESKSSAGKGGHNAVGIKESSIGHIQQSTSVPDVAAVTSKSISLKSQLGPRNWLLPAGHGGGGERTAESASRHH